jgi:hypothetical protein
VLRRLRRALPQAVWTRLRRVSAFTIPDREDAIPLFEELQIYTF